MRRPNFWRHTRRRVPSGRAALYSVANWRPSRPTAGIWPPGECRLELALEQLGPHPRAVTGSVLSQYIPRPALAGPLVRSRGGGPASGPRHASAAGGNLLPCCAWPSACCCAQRRRGRMPGVREKSSTSHESSKTAAASCSCRFHHGHLAEIAPRAEAMVSRAMRRCRGARQRRRRAQTGGSPRSGYWPAGRWHVNRCCKRPERGARARRPPVAERDCRAATPVDRRDKVLSLFASARSRSSSRHRTLRPPPARRSPASVADALGGAWHAEEAACHVALRWQLNCGRMPAARQAVSFTDCATELMHQAGLPRDTPPASPGARTGVEFGERRLVASLPPKMGPLCVHAGRQVRPSVTFSASRITRSPGITSPPAGRAGPDWSAAHRGAPHLRSGMGLLHRRSSMGTRGIRSARL